MKDVIVVRFNPDATPETLAQFQDALEHVDCDLDGALDYSIQAYDDGFGRIVHRQDTVRSYAS